MKTQWDVRALYRKLTVHGLAFFAQQFRELFVHDGFVGCNQGSRQHDSCRNPHD
jgi:hypothetical protein